MDVSKKLGSLQIVQVDHDLVSSQRMACKSQVLLAVGMLSALSDHIASQPNPKIRYIKGFWKTELWIYMCMYVCMFVWV